MTKPIVAVAALRLVQDGRLGLDDPVETWLPELADRQVLRTPGVAARGYRTRDDADHAASSAHQHLGLRGHDHAVAAAGGHDRQPDGGRAGAGVRSARRSGSTRSPRCPLAFQPGAGWRYHHSFGILGILLSRAGRRLVEGHLSGSSSGRWAWSTPGTPCRSSRRIGSRPPTDTWAARWSRSSRPLPASPSRPRPSTSAIRSSCRPQRTTRHSRGCWRPAVDTTGRWSSRRSCSRRCKRIRCLQGRRRRTASIPGFWDGTGWGYGVAMQTEGEDAGRYGWSGGLGTDFSVDPDGSFRIVLSAGRDGRSDDGAFRGYPVVGEASDPLIPADAHRVLVPFQGMPGEEDDEDRRGCREATTVKTVSRTRNGTRWRSVRVGWAPKARESIARATRSAWRMAPASSGTM